MRERNGQQAAVGTRVAILNCAQTTRLHFQQHVWCLYVKHLHAYNTDIIQLKQKPWAQEKPKQLPTQYINLFWQPKFRTECFTFNLCIKEHHHRIFPMIIFISLWDWCESDLNKNKAVTGTKSKILSGSANSFHNNTRKITYKHSVPGSTNDPWAVSWPSAAFHNGFYFIITLWEKTIDIDWFPLVRGWHLKQLPDTKDKK